MHTFHILVQHLELLCGLISANIAGLVSWLTSCEECSPSASAFLNISEVLSKWNVLYLAWHRFYPSAVWIGLLCIAAHGFTCIVQQWPFLCTTGIWEVIGSWPSPLILMLFLCGVPGKVENDIKMF